MNAVAPVLLPAAWVAFVLGGAWRYRPTAVRGLGAPPRETVRSGPDLAGALTQMLSRLARKPVSRALAGRLGVGALVVSASVIVLPLAAPLAVAAVWVGPAVQARRRARAERAAVLRHLPEVVDLFVLATGSGLTVPLAVEAVARRSASGGALAEPLRQVVQEVALGRRLVDALADLPARLGEPVRPLVAALIASERYGAPLLDRLTRLAHEVRADRRRRAEEAARRVPIKLLFPLVFCILPAFALLTVAPLVAGALRTLRL